MKNHFKPGFFEELFLYIVIQIIYKGVSKNLKKWFFKAPFPKGFFNR